MGKCINIYGEQCIPDGEMLHNLRDWMTKEVEDCDLGIAKNKGVSMVVVELHGRKQLAEEVLKFYELRYPSFLPHRRIESTYEAAQEYLDPFRYPNDT